MTNILDGEGSWYLFRLNSKVCSKCKHYNIEDIETHTCKAFPDGIPRDIWLGENDHTKLYPGDHGILFEKV
jgi:hypothetical protein